jgi:FecR protein
MSCYAFRRFLIFTLLWLPAALPALADSHVRIVRLSVVEGSVKVDRGTGQFEKAIINLPITQGMKLRTGNDGRAEVELEDGSTLRLVPDTSVQFPELSLRDSGTKVSVVEVRKGTAYAESVAGRDAELTLEFGHEKAILPRGSHVRLGVDERGATLAVFKGDLNVDTTSGEIALKKNQSANFDFAANDNFTLAKKIQQEPEDDWDKEQDQYHQQYAGKSYNNYSPYAYGSSDLAYYGNFSSYPGYGMLWQPYFVGTGWDPFMDGAWAFSPGFGFGWVSAYPWGWTPYHYGTWLFLPGVGWAWQPGGVWMPWYSQPAVLNPPSGFVAPHAPASGTGTVIVNRGPTSTLAGSMGSKLVIRANSAGLGVPRGQFDNMAKLSQKVAARGTVTEHVAAMPAPGFAPMSTSGGAPRSRASDAAISEPRMSAPPMSAPSSSASSGSSEHAHK